MRSVEACIWAVFPNEGPFPATLQDTMAGVCSEWLPASGYEVINVPAFSFTKMDEHKKLTIFLFCFYIHMKSQIPRTIVLQFYNMLHVYRKTTTLLILNQTIYL